MSKTFTIYTTETSAVAVSNRITTLIDLNQIAAQTGIPANRLSRALRGEYYSMHLPKGTRLTDTEKLAIHILRDAGFSQLQICNATGRSHYAVRNVVGRQPKEVSVANQIAGKKLSRMKAENALRLIVEANPSITMKKIG